LIQSDSGDSVPTPWKD